MRYNASENQRTHAHLSSASAKLFEGNKKRNNLRCCKVKAVIVNSNYSWRELRGILSHEAGEAARAQLRRRGRAIYDVRAIKQIFSSEDERIEVRERETLKMTNERF